MKLNFRSNKTVFNKGKLSKKKNFTPRTDPFFNYQLGEFKFEHPWGYTFFLSILLFQEQVTQVRNNHNLTLYIQYIIKKKDSSNIGIKHSDTINFIVY